MPDAARRTGGHRFRRQTIIHAGRAGAGRGGGMFGSRRLMRAMRQTMRRAPRRMPGRLMNAHNVQRTKSPNERLSDSVRMRASQAPANRERENMVTMAAAKPRP